MTNLVELEEPHRSILGEAEEVAVAIEPFAVEADDADVLDERVLDVLRASGLFRLMVGADHGGRFEGIDSFAVCLVREALMARCSHADSLFALQGIGSYAISSAGTDEQRDRWLPSVADGSALGGLALTEPEAGSDLKSITTTVTERDGVLRLDGAKSFISNAGVAAFYTTLVREEAGLSVVLVPADVEGLSTTPAPQLIAPHILGDVTFDGVELPASARIGAPGAGLSVVLSTLAMFRVSVAGAAVGLARTALEESTRHARSREQFGRPLARLGPVASLLADSWAELESTRLLTYRAARLAAEDPLAHLDHSSLAKLAATEACSRIVDRSVQVMGRWGLVRNSRIERCYRQSRPMRIYEGSSEVLRLGIARRLCQEVG